MNRKYIKLSDLFDVQYGSNLEFNKMIEEENGIPFVSCGEKNNGVCGFVSFNERYKINPENTISIACNGSVMESFLQTEKYYSGRDVYYLEPKISLTQNQILFYCMCLRANKYKYSYGRKANRALKDILVPNIDEIPSYVEEIKISLPSKDSVTQGKISLNQNEWKDFELQELFNICGTKTTFIDTLEKYGDGSFPYVTTKAANNGVKKFFNFETEEGNIITIESAIMGYCSYQEKNFSASDHVEKLKPKFTLNKYIAMFLVTILNNEQYRFSYGRKASQISLQTLKIKLPIDSNSLPDWKFMEDYIKSLPYSASL